ncbi:MAG: ribonuclease HII [Candidatus Bathyarchaeota archaeon]|nr:MAG: ribonuclease HII [Candidatus Bathyarchaeota archaeon]
MRIAGVDDAGRGSVIGPLVIAGILIKKENLHQLVALGVKDSKLLSPHKREQLAEEIRKTVLQYHFVALSPSEIDVVVETGRKLRKLNHLEARTMAEVVAMLKPDIAYVDASDVLEERYGQHIRENVPFEVQIVSEHKADAKYPVVSAASIIAKVERDKAIQELQEKFGELGSGYMSDRKTVVFLEQWIRQFGTYPEFVRKSWKPAKRIQKNAGTKQTTLP